MPRTGLVSCVALTVTLSALSLSCGGGSGEPVDGTGSGSLRIETAEWREAPEPRAVVSGEWGVVVSTPPSCTLLEGEEGKPSGWQDPGGRIELDGGRFYQELVRAPASKKPEALAPATEYYVRCRVSTATGKTIEATAAVKGDVPVS